MFSGLDVGEKLLYNKSLRHMDGLMVMLEAVIVRRSLVTGQPFLAGPVPGENE